jgi:hypothetical protein
MKKQPTFLLLVLACASLFVMPASAGLILEKKAEPQASPNARQTRLVNQSARLSEVTKINRQRIDLESRVSSRISQSGTPPVELPILVGFGRSVTLEDALRQILPAGWTAFSDQDLNIDAKVDWQGTRTWPLALQTVLATLDMRAHIDWDTTEIMFFVPQIKDSGQPLVANVVEEPTAPASPTGVKKAAGATVWELSPERSLRENFRLWANQAGWTLVWNAVRGDSVIDYPVDALIEFEGEAIGVNGAMARVIAAYSDADFPLEIEFYRGNKVIEIRLHRQGEAPATLVGRRN